MHVASLLLQLLENLFSRLKLSNYFFKSYTFENIFDMSDVSKDSGNLDDEWVEEESLVLLELSGIIDLDYLSKCGNSCKILGVETEEPVLQLGNLIFAGKYKDTLGTVVIFEQDKEQVYNEEAPNVKQWKYKCHTFKKLDMTRAFIRPKEQDSDAEAPLTSEKSDDQQSDMIESS